MKNKFLEIILRNPDVKTLLEKSVFSDEEDWYLGGASLSQTVWNHLSGLPINHGIKDYDCIYYNPDDLSEESEACLRYRLRKMIAGLVEKEIDLVNEARVHLWYEEEFGKKINQYISCADAIDSWPIMAAMVGVKRFSNGTFEVYAPSGLYDIFNMVLRPNKKMITEDVYLKKVSRWTRAWPKLEVIPWDQE